MRQAKRSAPYALHRASLSANVAEYATSHRIVSYYRIMTGDGECPGVQTGME